MPRMDKLSTYRTNVTTSADGKDICVVYVNTCVVQFDDKRIILRNGGWDTVTTRRKMNQAANQFKLPYLVYRKDGETYVSARGGDKQPFVDGMELAR